MLASAHPSPQPKRHVDRFSRLCTAHVRVLSGIWTPSNTRFPAHPTQHPNWHIDQFSRFCTTHSRLAVPIVYNACPFPPNCPFPRGMWTPSNIHDSLCPSKPTTPTEFRSVQPFLHSSPQSVPILYNRSSFLPQNFPFPWGIWTPSNTCYLGSTHQPN